jgi:large subunit ribosomal protein L17
MKTAKRLANSGMDASFRKAMLKNLAMSLIIDEKIKTTVTRAKALAPFIERLINTGKKKDKLHVIRELNRLVTHEGCSRKIIEELVNKYSDRNSGYTRITRAGFRAGDNASMVYIELV